MEGLRGVGRSERVGFASFVLASLALVGIPPTSGFFSKWRIAGEAYIAYGAAPVAVVAAGTVISLLYYARIYHLGLSSAPLLGETRRAARLSLLLVGVLGAATLVFGLVGPTIEAIVQSAARRISATRSGVAMCEL